MTATPVETPDRTGAYPRLSDDQLAALELHGTRRHTRAGDLLFREGDIDYDFFVVLSGKVAVYDETGGASELIAVHGAKRFLGELSLLIGQASPFTALVREDGEALQVPVERLRDLAAHDPLLGDLLLRAYVLRRSLLIGLGAGFRIIGSRFSPDTRRLRDFAARNRLPHSWVDLEEDPAAEALLRGLGVAPRDTPVVMLRGDRVLRNPSNIDLARVLGLRGDEEQTVCDLLVVGAGPAGLAAAVYGASEGLDTVALDGVAAGGQASTSSRIENYLGFPSGVSGGELADRATIQARKFGARIVVPGEAVALEPSDGRFAVQLRDGATLFGRAILIATGARYRRLPVARLEELERTSVYYAATQMEARVCRGDPVVIVGGGNSAGQATLFLHKHAAQVTLVVREPALGANMSRYLADQIVQLENVEVLLHTEVRELRGPASLEAVVVEDTVSRERRALRASALFVFIGACPHTEWLGGRLELDSGGYILTGPDTGRPGAQLLQTSVPGVFAAGDVRHGSIMRVASAVGEGSMAVKLLHAFLERPRDVVESMAMAAPG